MKITSISVMINTHSSDLILLTTDLPLGAFPFQGNQVFKTEVSAGTGIEYVKKNFPNRDFKIIDLEEKR